LVRRERKRGKSIHYEVDPEELHRTEGLTPPMLLR
jgi:hypothetical protein